MKIRAAIFLFALALAALVSGCASTESENTSQRPWDAPQGWENNGALGGMNTQHQ